MELGRNLDWADEVRESASIRMADYQQRAVAHYNRKAQPRASKLERWSSKRFSKTPLKGEPKNSKRIEKALTLCPRQVKAEPIIYRS